MSWVWWAVGGALVLGFNLGVLLMAAVSAGARADDAQASAWERRGWSPKDHDLGIGA